MNAAVQGLTLEAIAIARARSPLTRLGLALACLIAMVGWLLPLRQYLSPRSGLGYALGIIGASLMLMTLVYSARTRFPRLAFLGATRSWFELHVAFGVVGPILILFHCGYRTGATNSNVALFSMLVVAASGVIGRYLPRHVGKRLDAQQSALAELCAVGHQIGSASGGSRWLLPEFSARLEDAERRIVRNVFLVPVALSAALLYRVERVRLHLYVGRALWRLARTSNAIAARRLSLAVAVDRYADQHLIAARRVAEFECARQLSSGWHAMHLPLLVMLLGCGVVHVIAVSVY